MSDRRGRLDRRRERDSPPKRRSDRDSPSRSRFDREQDDHSSAKRSRGSSSRPATLSKKEKFLKFKHALNRAPTPDKNYAEYLEDILLESGLEMKCNYLADRLGLYAELLLFTGRLNLDGTFVARAISDGLNNVKDETYKMAYSILSTKDLSDIEALKDPGVDALKGLMSGLEKNGRTAIEAALHLKVKEKVVALPAHARLLKPKFAALSRYIAAEAFQAEMAIAVLNRCATKSRMAVVCYYRNVQMIDDSEDRANDNMETDILRCDLYIDDIWLGTGENSDHGAATLEAYAQAWDNLTSVMVDEILKNHKHLTEDEKLDKSIVDIVTGGNQDPKPICNHFIATGGCHLGSACAFMHPGPAVSKPSNGHTATGKQQTMVPNATKFVIKPPTDASEMTKPVILGKGLKCHKCGESGHIIRECPSRVRSGFRGLCYTCGESGHVANQCKKGGPANAAMLSMLSVQDKSILNAQSGNFQTGQARDFKPVQPGNFQADQMGNIQADAAREYQAALASSSNFAGNIHQSSSLPRSLSPRSVMLEGNQNRATQPYDSMPPYSSSMSYPQPHNVPGVTPYPQPHGVPGSSATNLLPGVSQPREIRKPDPGEVRVKNLRKQSTTEIVGIQIEALYQGGIFVSYVVEDSLAARNSIFVGDQILEFCGVTLRSATKESAIELMMSFQNTLESELVVQYNPEKMFGHDSMQNSQPNMESPAMRVKAQPNMASPAMRAKAQPITSNMAQQQGWICGECNFSNPQARLQCKCCMKARDQHDAPGVSAAQLQAMPTRVSVPVPQQPVSLMDVVLDDSIPLAERKKLKILVTESDPIDTRSSNIAGLLQHTTEDLSRSMTDMIILETAQLAKSPFGILKDNATRSGLLIEWSIGHSHQSKSCKCDIYIQKVFQASAVDRSKAEASNAAAVEILGKLYKTNTVLRVQGQSEPRYFTWRQICQDAHNWDIPDDPDMPDVHRLSVEGADPKGHAPMEDPKAVVYACFLMKKHVSDKSNLLKDMKIANDLPLRERTFLVRYCNKYGFRCNRANLFSIKLLAEEIVDIVKQSPTASVGKYRLLRLGTKFVSTAFKSMLGIPLFDDNDNTPKVWHPETVTSNDVADTDNKTSETLDKFVVGLQSNKDKLEAIHGPHTSEHLQKPLSSFVLFLREESTTIPPKRAFFIVSTSASRGGYLLEWIFEQVHSKCRCKLFLQKKLFTAEIAAVQAEAQTNAFHAAYKKLCKTSTFVLIRNYATEFVNLWPWDHVTFKASKWNPSPDEVINLDSFADKPLTYPNVLQYALVILRESITDPIRSLEDCIFQNMPENEAKCLTTYATSVLKCQTHEAGDPGKRFLHLFLRLTVEEIMSALSENDGEVGRYKIIPNPDNPLGTFAKRQAQIDKVPRSNTKPQPMTAAVSAAQDMGQSDDEFQRGGEQDWLCGNCEFKNSRKRTECMNCTKPRSSNDTLFVRFPSTNSATQAKANLTDKKPMMGSTDWSCGNCNFVNYNSDMYCTECSTPRRVRQGQLQGDDEGTWSCGNCTFLNYNSSSRCSECTAPRKTSGKPRGFEELKNDWECGSCNFMNPEMRQTCKKCHDQRPPPVVKKLQPAVRQVSGDWKCGKCTFVNFGSRTNCKECGKKRSPSDMSLGKNVKPTATEGDAVGDVHKDWTCGHCRYMNFAKRSICNYCGKKRVIGIKEASLSLGANGDSRSLGPSTPYSDSTKPFMRVQVKAEPKQADTEPWECGCGNINAAECPTCLGCKAPKRRTQEPARDAGRGKFEMLQEPARDAGRGKFEMLQEPARDAGRGKFEMLQEPARDAGRGRFEMLQEPARGASRGRFETSQDDSIRKRAREAGREMNDISLDKEMQERGRAAGRGTNVPHADVPARSFEKIRQGSKEAQVSRADRNAGGNYGAGRGMDIPPANKAPASKPPSLMEGMVARSELAAVPPGYWTCGQCQRVNYAGKIMCDKCCAPRENADLVIAEVEAGRQYSDSNRSLLLKFFPNGEDMSRPISDLIILEQMEWSKSAFMALDESAARAGLLVEWEYKEVVNMVSCKLYIQKRLVSSSSKSSRNQAQDEVALAALADLYKTNKVIQVRPQEDSNIWYTWQSIQRGARNSPIPSIEDLISIAGFVSNSVDVAGVSTLLNQPIKSSKETLFACHIMLAHFTDFSGRLQDCIFHPSLPEHVRKFLMNFSTKLKLNCRIGSIHDEPDTTYPCFSINVSFSEIVNVLDQCTTEVGKYRLLKMGTKQFASLLGVPGFDTVKQIDPSVTSPISSQTPAFDSRDIKPVADDNMRPVMNDGQSIDEFTGSNKDNSGLRNDGANSTETSNQTPEMKKSEKTKKIKLMKGSWSNREQMHSDVDVSRSVLDLIVLEPEDLSEARDQNAFTILTASCTRNDMLVEWTLDPTDSGHRCQVYIQTELYADQLSKEWQDARRLAFGEAMLKVYKSNPVIVKMKTKLEDVKWTWEKLQSFADQWNPDVNEIVSVPSRTEHGILQNARAVSFACCTLKRQMNDRSLKFENECTFTKMPDADMFYVKDFAQELGYMVKIKKQRGNYILITTRRISLTELVNELINSPSGCLGRYRMLKQIEIDDYSSKQQYEASDGQGSGDMDWEYV